MHRAQTAGTAQAGLGRSKRLAGTAHERLARADGATVEGLPRGRRRTRRRARPRHSRSGGSRAGLLLFQTLDQIRTRRNDRTSLWLADKRPRAGWTRRNGSAGSQSRTSRARGRGTWRYRRARHARSGRSRGRCALRGAGKRSGSNHVRRRHLRRPGIRLRGSGQGRRSGGSSGSGPRRALQNAAGGTCRLRRQRLPRTAGSG